MKLKIKGLLGLVLSLVLVLTMMPMTAKAATYYVAGDSALCGENWDPKADAMTASGDGTYSITYKNVAEGSYSFKVTDGSWDNCWGDNGNNYTFTNKSQGDVTITFNASTYAITVSGKGAGAYVFEADSITAVGAGSGAFLNGEEWKVDAAANHMTNNSGVWSITYTGVAAGTYEFKFAANDSWTNNWGTGAAVESGTAYDAFFEGGNCSITIATDNSTVTLSLDLTNYDASAKTGAVVKAVVSTGSSSDNTGSDNTGSGSTGSDNTGSSNTGSATTEATYYVAGTMNNWNCADAAYKMVKSGDNYVFTMSLEAGEHKLKVTDGTWNNSWGGKEGNTDSDGNYVFTISEAGNVTVTFSAAKEVTVTVGGTVIESTGSSNSESTETKTGSHESATVAGDFSALTNCNVTKSWDVTDTACDMKYLGNGVYVFEVTFDKTTADANIEFKVAFNHAWDENIGFGGANGNNVTVTVPAGTTTFKIIASEKDMVVYDSINNAAEVANYEAIAQKGDNNMVFVYAMMLALGCAMVVVAGKKKFAK